MAESVKGGEAAPTYRSPVDILRDSPEWINPVFDLTWQLKERELTVGLDLDYLLDHNDKIQAAIKAGEEETKDAGRALDMLKQVAGVSAEITPIGF